MSQKPPTSRYAFEPTPLNLIGNFTNSRFPCYSFGDPNAQPPTPQQTPDAFASPVFDTPRHPQGSFAESGGLTPRFAEDYSVFNATPGNLRGSAGAFGEFIPATPSSFSGHKRLLSTDSVNFDTTLASPNSNQQAPFSPDTSAPAKNTPSSQSRAKSRRGTVGEGSEPTQVLSPPPTARKAEQKQSDKLIMHNEQGFAQPDFGNMSQPPELALITTQENMYGYPLSAPPVAGNFWDAHNNMGMDISFDGQNMYPQSAHPSSHRPSGSFDWNSDIQLFQDPNQPPPSSNQENMQPGMHMMVSAAPPMDQLTAPMNSNVVPAQFQTSMSMGMMPNGDGVNPDLLLSRPSSATMDEFTLGELEHLEAPQSVPHKRAGRSDGRRSSAGRGGKMPDRAFASSPLKSSRPGLSRSFSENRGRKALARGGPLPTLAPAGRPSAPTRGELARRNSGRVSPLKSQRRLSGLASIPEAPLRQLQVPRRSSVRFTIDAQGRARAETTLVGERPGLPRSQSSRDLSFRSQWQSSEDDDSDEEPIIIPSRNNSFSASFALPDPRKPVGSVFSKGISDRSSNRSGSRDDDSDAETLMNESQSKGDAASELRRVVRGRQKRASLGASVPPHRLLTNLGHFNDGTISPSSLTESGYGTDGQGVRCVCNRSGTGDGDGFMLQW